MPTETPSIFTRGPLDVVPHPLRAYSRKAKLPIYFEIYNLITDDDGVSSYTIEYKIIPHSNAKPGFWSQFNEASPVVSSKFQTSAFGDSDRRNIQIDTSNLRKGSYDLLITVTDDETRGRSFTRGTFSLVD